MRNLVDKKKEDFMGGDESTDMVDAEELLGENRKSQEEETMLLCENIIITVVQVEARHYGWVEKTE